MSTIESPGCVILLIDESAAMDSPVEEAAGPGGGVASGQTPKSKSASVATAVNALLKRLGGGPDFDIALVGYHTDDDQTVVQSRWDGTLQGRTFVPVCELADAPACIEERIRKLPNPAGFGPPVEQPVQFPVWYAAEPNGQACQVAAFQHCRELLDEWLKTAGANPGAPLIIHVFAGGSGDGNPHQVVQEVMSLEAGEFSPVVIQAHLSTSRAVPPTLYPSNRYFLPAGPQKDLFPRCSVLPVHLVSALKAANVTANENAVSMAYNARMLDIVTLLKLVDAHTQGWPARTASIPVETAPEAVPELSADAVSEDDPSAATDVTPPETEDTQEQAEASEGDTLGATADAPVVESMEEDVDGEDVPEAKLEEEPTAPVEEEAAPEQERAALVIFVLDRSLSDPFNAGTDNACSRLQENANSLIDRLAKKPTDVIDVAVLSYCTDVAGDMEVRSGFEGSLAGQTFVRDTDLMDGALRIDEFTKKVPDGVGGLMERPVKQPIFLELEPAAAGSPVPAFEAVGQLLTEWCQSHPNSMIPPVVLHLTRGELDPDSIAEAASSLKTAVDSVLLYHLIATEEAHCSLIFADQLEDGEPEGLLVLFENTSPLLDRERLSVEKPSVVQAESRGFVINGKIDLVPDTILEILAPPE